MQDKLIYSDQDFDELNWHDNKIHAISFDEDKFELLFDIDYILNWQLETDGSNYKFLVSPASLIFRNVYNIEISANTTSIIIQEILRANPRPPKNEKDINDTLEFDWEIETVTGKISFTSTGFSLFIRNLPKAINSQNLNMEQRGGLSFAANYS